MLKFTHYDADEYRIWLGNTGWFSIMEKGKFLPLKRELECQLRSMEHYPNQFETHEKGFIYLLSRTMPQIVREMYINLYLELKKSHYESNNP